MIASIWNKGPYELTAVETTKSQQFDLMKEGSAQPGGHGEDMPRTQSWSMYVVSTSCVVSMTHSQKRHHLDHRLRNTKVFRNPLTALPGSSPPPPHTPSRLGGFRNQRQKSTRTAHRQPSRKGSSRGGASAG